MRRIRHTRDVFAPQSRAIQIVATPGSGNGRALGTALGLREALRAHGRQARLDVFSDLNGLRRWVAAGDTNFSLLICVGGDGTLETAAAAAVRRSVPFLPVPSGFGNLFGRALGQPTRMEQVIDLLEHGELVHVDVGVRNGEPFVCQESFGLLADIQNRVEEGGNQPRIGWWRFLAYYRMALRHVLDTPLTALRVSVDGRVVARDAAIVIVANVETYGPWLRLTPGASPIDGLLDVFAMGRTSKREILATLLRWQLRLPGPDPGALVCRGRRVSIAAPNHVRDEIDLLPRRLPVVVSSEAAEALQGDLARVRRVA